MIRLITADLGYGFLGLISAAAVLFLPLFMPLLGGLDLAQVGPLAGTSMALISPLAATMVAWQLLIFESDERRLRFWAALPLRRDDWLVMRRRLA